MSSVLNFYLDFTPFVPEQLTPKYAEIISFLNQEVSDMPRGSVVIQQRPGVFRLKIFNSEKGEKLRGKTVPYFLRNDKERKKPIKIKFETRDTRKQWFKPRYVNITGFHKTDLSGEVSNVQLTEFFSSYVDILVDVKDKLQSDEDVWGEDKKTFRIDLNKGVEITRTVGLIHSTIGGINVRGEVRITYKDQPFFCRQCQVHHQSGCPLWKEKDERKEEIKKKKSDETSTLIIGDSNLKLINENAILADVVASSGAKYGHVANQIQSEDLEKYENIIIMAGTNNVPSEDESFDIDKLWSQTTEEIDALLSKVKSPIKNGKKIRMVEIPDSPHCRTSKKVADFREKANQYMRDKVAGYGRKNIGIIEWPETKPEHFGNKKGITEQLTSHLLGSIDEAIDGKLRAPYLDSKITSAAYRNVTSVYPFGCGKCTKLSHSRLDCRKDWSKKGRLMSDDQAENQQKKAAPEGQNAYFVMQSNA